MTLPSMFVKACEIEKGSVVNVVFGLDGVLVMSRCGDGEVVERLLRILESIEEKARGQDGGLVDEGF